MPSIVPSNTDLAKRKAESNAPPSHARRLYAHAQPTTQQLGQLLIRKCPFMAQGIIGLTPIVCRAGIQRASRAMPVNTAAAPR
jgi:hypothetical protein